MSRAPAARIFIRPKMTNVGRGQEPVRIPYKEGGVLKVLPPEGALVLMTGGNRSFWIRRMNEGAVEEVRQPATAPAPSPVRKVNNDG